MGKNKIKGISFFSCALYHLKAIIFQVLLILNSASNTYGQNSEKPNFIIIFTDDQGYNDVGCFGAENIKTPSLDKMADEGIKLTSFYSQPVCGPARAALLTGCYPNRIKKGGWNVESSEITIAEVLKEAGYKTACIGKWDISGRKFKDGMVPNDQGFDFYFGTLAANDMGKVELWRNKQLIEETGDMGSLTGLYTKEAIKFIKKNMGKPFFLYIAHSMPHVKLGASSEFLGQSNRGLYGDVIQELDWNIGLILNTLKELDLDKSTYVIFTSDNGPWQSKGDMGGSAFPLRGGKGSAWEGGFRVPCIIRAPGRVPENVESNELISTLDFMPTIATLADAKMPNDRIIDGIDQSNFITGKTNKSNRETFYYYVRGNLHAVRYGKWKLALSNRKKFYDYAKDSVKIISPELYDLENDISEKFNISNKHPEMVNLLLEKAEEARYDIGDVGLVGKGTRKAINKSN